MMDPASDCAALGKRAGMAPGDIVVIIGPGPMGFMVLQCALALGAGRVMVGGSGRASQRPPS